MAGFDNDIAATMGYLGGAFASGFGAGVWITRFLNSHRPPPPEINIKAPEKSLASNAAVWNRRRPTNPKRPLLTANGGKPIICVANMKGGVGKTTVVANLAAYLSTTRGKRVLVIDLDYQGSLTTTCLTAADITDYKQSAQLVLSKNVPQEVLDKAENLRPKLPSVDILTSFYDLATIETDSMVDWLTEAVPEVRFHLAEFLSSSPVQTKYDFILIDAPPRFTTGSVNALCASTHLLVPTILDNLSSEAVVYLAEDIERMRSDLWPNLKIIGVLPTLTRTDDIGASEEDVARGLERDLKGKWQTPAPLIMREARIPRRQAIRDVAGTGIAYLIPGKNGRDSQNIFDRLGIAVESRL